MHGGRAERAVDGSRDPRFAQGSCTHTRTVDYPTWVVDLGYLSEIYMVNVTNRDGGLIRSENKQLLLPINSLDPAWCGSNIERLIIENMLRIKFMNTAYKIALM